MTSRSPDFLSSIFSSSAPAPTGSMIPMKVNAEPVDLFEEPVPRRRTRIWDMHHTMHCSIIGTCLSCGELRRLLVKLGVHGADKADDHTLHKQAVAMAGKPHDGAKFIQKALDRAHETAIKLCSKVKDEDGLLLLWEDALKRGDIPGLYWAVLSHPVATDKIMRRAFGDVHMLSHIVGAANRADIRRLRQLEQENTTLAAKIDLQESQLRDGFTARDAKIRLLNDALSRALAHAPTTTEHVTDDSAALREALRDLDRRLKREVVGRERLEARLKTLTQALTEAERRRQGAECENGRLRDELSFAEERFNAWLAEGANGGDIDPEGSSALVLCGVHVLYVGGRANQVPQLKAAVERAGGTFLYHDGGIEHSTGLLPGLVSRAGCAAFPIDCISHHAMAIVKRLCRQSGKPFMPLRTSSLTSLLSGVATLHRTSEGARAH